jgi:hypothetical protein
VRNRPPIWTMLREAIDALGGEATGSQIVDCVQEMYGDVKRSSIRTHITTCTVNAPSRIYDGRNHRPRVAASRYDFLFQTNEGVLVLYDPNRHRSWELRARVDGSVVVALVGGPEFPPGPRRSVSGPRREKKPWSVPGRAEFLRGIEEYERREQREAVYKLASFVVARFWGEHWLVADAVSALLVSWNQAFYRYGMFDIAKLERSIGDNCEAIEGFRARDISTLVYGDDKDWVQLLFYEFLEALQIVAGSSRGRKSPVSPSKALHLMAPTFFPIWDRKIAPAYGCPYVGNPGEAYWRFCRVTRAVAKATRGYTARRDKSLVKLIDEYNYSKFAKGWI